MESLTTFMLFVLMLVNQMGSPDYYQRERATKALCELVNKNDLAPLLHPYSLHSNPEIASRVKKVLVQYYNPVASIKFGHQLPLLTAFNGQTDEDWRRCFEESHVLVTTYECESPEPTTVTWQKNDEYAPRLATLDFVKTKWRKQGLTRKQVVDMIDDIARDEISGLHFEIYLPNQGTGNCPGFDIPIPMVEIVIPPRKGMKKYDIPKYWLLKEWEP